MVLAQVPIYIYWGTCDRNAKRSFRNFPPTVLKGRWVSQNCYPSDEDLVKAVEFALDVGPSEPSVAEPHVAELRVPKPEKGSGQKKGETWQQFFARRAEGNKAKQAHETPTQLLARQARAKHALKDRVPGRGGAVVFQWMDVGGFRIRSSIGRDLAGLLWEDYTETQRRYDPFANQWDICTEFDPSAVPPQPLEPGNTAADPSTHHTTTFVGDTIPTSESPQFPPLEDVLYERYGFVYSPSQQPAPPSTPISQLAMKICEGQATLPHSRTLRDAAAAFLAGLIDGRSLNSPDMLDGSLRDQYMSGSVTVKQCRGTRIALEGSSTPGVFYLINFRQTTSSPFSICLDDPMAVLQVIRAQFGANSPDLALQLASRGIPFSTRIASSKLPTPIPPKVPQGLGFLPFQYRPRPSDYSSYLDRRDRLLRRNYARVALTKGGIIARLARDSVGSHMNVLVGSGPSEDVCKYGTAIRIGTDYLWDDELDPNDEQIICGVYKISTGLYLPFPLAPY
ncbi:hypothetical protein HD554DRAFT_2032838 [Boletus coccyginus]|nr:hypothetical protein HD554DRAFT_2032838 [Boletus coccyginus]